MALLPDEWTALRKSEQEVLMALAIGGPDNGDAIHRRRPNSARSSTHKALNRLEDAGYVTREQVDGPMKRRVLTDAGRELVQQGIVNVAERVNT